MPADQSINAARAAAARVAASLDGALSVALADGPATEVLGHLHQAVQGVARLREQVAELRAVAAAEAHETGTVTYPMMALQLDVSEPLIQSLVYKGRRLRANPPIRLDTRAVPSEQYVQAPPTDFWISVTGGAGGSSNAGAAPIPRPSELVRLVRDPSDRTIRFARSDQAAELVMMRQRTSEDNMALADWANMVAAEFDVAPVAILAGVERLLDPARNMVAASIPRRRARGRATTT